MRAGTENTIGICALGKAELALDEMAEDQKKVEGLKQYIIKRCSPLFLGEILWKKWRIR